jgi:DNA repair protein SbcC/Rad50
MIPLHLRISGFLSYRDPVELDFNSFKLASISGSNGAGKSSLLDSITWSLFGEARGKGMDVINAHQDVKAAEVALTFAYENNVYRVQRTLPRGKSTVLEFQVRDANGWRPLTEKTTRETQARIEQILRLDHETFINASFFLQGRADQFTQKKASERKAVLSTILGLESWNIYRDRAAEKRKLLESEILGIDGRMTEIEAELAEESTRKDRLAELESTLKQLSARRAAHESVLENMRKNAALLDEQRKLVETFSISLERAREALISLEVRLAEKEKDRETYADLVSRAKEIDSAFKAWQKSRKELEDWDKTALEFLEHEKDRTPLLEQIAAERARLEEEKRSLLSEEEAVSDQRSSVTALQAEIDEATKYLKDAEAKVKARAQLEGERNTGRERQAALKVENETLKVDMNQLKQRIETLKSTDGASCPLCGQELSEAHRKSTLKQLETDGREKGDRFRANKSDTDALEKEIAHLESRIADLSNAGNERVTHAATVSQLTERIQTLQSLAKDWEKTGRKRLAGVVKELEKETFAPEARKQLAKLDKELTKLGYDTSAHDAKRKEELELRVIDDDHRKLESAREVTKQIEGEIKNLNSELVKRNAEIAEQEKSHHKAAQTLAEIEAGSPDLNEVERELFSLREEENDTRDQVGGARQKVEILSKRREQRVEQEKQREALNQQIVRYKSLERAFGKDGVPALLIEQALPQIEQKTNDLLERLSDGQMSIRFVTQDTYKDKKRDDLRETLDIQISDSAGARDYEMYSGGEAFRVNFAIRLALSEILAQRKGARLQTLVIDEGFGSQDAQGRQRLIEAINIVKNDFEKILIITHLDELKDAFPNRIEVEKTERGSTVRVV